MSGIVIAIDAGTTGIRSAAIDQSGNIISFSYREFTQHFPQPGWVEHDAEEIWQTTLTTLAELGTMITDAGPVATIGITNQRETVVAWDRTTGEPLHHAIVWQDRRTAARCRALEEAGHLDLFRQRTGLVLDPYFSGTKIAWLFEEAGVPIENTAVGTIDTWLIYKLTGGAAHVTEPSNASRTLLFDIDEMAFSAELCDALGVPIAVLPDVGTTSGRFGVTTDACPLGAGIPISGAAGDQQAALFGQACFSPGDAKNTYGTGSFVLMNLGADRPAPTEGLLTSVAWTLPGQPTTYCAEGAIFVTGAAVQWLRDGLNIIDEAPELEPLALQCDNTGGVMFVPALTGLGSPWWDPNARGTIVGITRGTGRPEMARAVIEAMAYQTRDVVDAMGASATTTISRLRVDGGASVMDTLCQMQADQLGVPVERPANQQTTVMGAAYLAGIAEGFWDSPDAVQAAWQLDRSFEPDATVDRSSGYADWKRAVERSLDWASDES
ncbi:MAG: glycerol kinase GlpK [Actinomycetota bacterium]